MKIVSVGTVGKTCSSWRVIFCLW